MECYLILIPALYPQLISHIEEEGLDTEGLLRIPGVATRVKVPLPEEIMSNGKNLPCG